MGPSNGEYTSQCLKLAATLQAELADTPGRQRRRFSTRAAHRQPAAQSETAAQPHMPGVARASVCRSVSLSWLAYWRRISTLEREAALSGTTIGTAMGMLLAMGSWQRELTPARHPHLGA